MPKKIKPNTLFDEKPEEKELSLGGTPAAIVGADENSIVGNKRMSSEDAKKLEQFEAMEKSLASLAEEKAMLEAKVAEYAEKLEALKSSADEISKLEVEKQELESKCKALEEHAAGAQKLEKEAKSLKDENDQLLIKISELTFENANLASQLAEFEKKAKAHGHIPNQGQFQPMSGLAQPRRDAYNPYANNGYGTW